MEVLHYKSGDMDPEGTSVELQTSTQELRRMRQENPTTALNMPVLDLVGIFPARNPMVSD